MVSFISKKTYRFASDFWNIFWLFDKYDYNKTYIIQKMFIIWIENTITNTWNNIIINNNNGDTLRLEIPILKEDVKKLKVGDVVYLNGTIYTGRDEAHLTIIEEYEKNRDSNEEGNEDDNNNELIKRFKNGVIYHAGPIMKKENNKWKCVAIGPTTSARMNEVEEKFIKITEISAIVGKGGMKKELLNVFKEYGVVYLAAPGGCAALLANSIVEVKDVHYYELGMPEAIWELEVKDFGPLIVAMDANGNSIYEKVNNNVLNVLNNLMDLNCSTKWNF